MIVASHDRYLVERVTDSVYAMFGDGRLIHLPGGVDEYLARIGTGPVAGQPGTQPPAAPASPGPPASGPSAADLRAAKKDVARLERALERNADQARRLHEEMAANATDYTRISALDEQLRGLATEQERLEEAWLVAAEMISGT